MRRADACTRGLVADDARVRAGSGPIPHGWACLERYAAIPSAARPQVLVPRRSPAAGAEALRAFSNAAPMRGRAAARTAAAAVRLGLARAMRGGVWVAVAAGTPAGELDDLVLSRHLAAVLGRDLIDLAVRVGANRPNGKPVVRASAGAEALAYAKIGWNDVTRGLVAAEADALRTLASHPPAAFAVPRLLHAGDWGGMTVTAVAPAGGGRLRPEPEPPAEATAELTRGAGVERAAVTAGPWWRSTRERIDRAGAQAQRALADRLADTFGGTELDHGRSHGDWSPWNMTRSGGRLVVWDWERASAGVPVGVDAAHHCLLVLMNARRQAPADAVRGTLDRAARLLEPLGVPAAAGPAIVAAELLEMSVRFAEAARAGVGDLDDRFGRALSQMLDGGYHGAGTA